MRRLLLVLATFLSLAAFDASAQRYAVISLIGDRMQIAYANGVEGQPVDRITRRYVALDDTSIDRAALHAADAKLRELVPGSEPVLLQAFERTYFDIDAGTAGIIDWIRNLVKNEKGQRVTRAIVVTKITYDGIPALQKPYLGSGTLEGVGFFLGRTPPPSGIDPNSAGGSFLSPFAYFEVALVDLQSGRVLKREKGLASKMFSGSSTDTGNAWDTLSSSQKVATLVEMVRTEMNDVLPRVLKP